MVLVLSFQLFIGSRDWAQVARLVWSVPLPDELSCWSVLGILGGAEGSTIFPQLMMVFIEIRPLSIYKRRNQVCHLSYWDQ